MFSYRARYDVIEFSNCHTEERSEAEFNIICPYFKKLKFFQTAVLEHFLSNDINFVGVRFTVQKLSGGGGGRPEPLQPFLCKIVNMRIFAGTGFENDNVGSGMDGLS